MRKWLAILLTMLLIPVLPASAEEESTVLTGKTAAEIVEMMGFRVESGQYAGRYRRQYRRCDRAGAVVGETRKSPRN